MTEEKSWKPLELVKVSADYLSSKGVPNARLDAEVLLVEVMGLKRRVDLYAGFETNISGKEVGAYRELIRRRAMREPVSRILGRREFMGLTFDVTPAVLSPRPETELLVETALAAALPKKQPAFIAEPETPAWETPEPQGPTKPDANQAAILEKLLDSYAEDIEDEDELEKNDASAAAPQREHHAPDGGNGDSLRPAPTVADRGDTGGMMENDLNNPPSGRKSGGKVGDKRKKNTDPIMPARQFRILDLGTGSGCIAVSIAAMLPGSQVVGVDASRDALAVAAGNARRAGVRERVELRQGNWLDACREGEEFDFILSNPPYLVKGDDGIWPEVSCFDPELALYAGDDGLDCYRAIIPGVPKHLGPGGRLLLEVGDGQADAVAAMIRQAGFDDIDVITDYGGIRRIVCATMGKKQAAN